MSKKAIELVDYSFRYANTEHWIIKDCNLSIEYGELVVLSGLSGEGKSTILSSINGIIPNVSFGEQTGEVRINGVSTSGKKMSKIAHEVGSVLQNPDSQIIHSKVEDEIAFGCENFNFSSDEIKNRIEKTCKMLSLDMDWSTKNLSGGQKQRLVTASVLAMGQKILLLDEPLANLDLEGAHILLSLLKKLTKDGYAILIVEHRLDVVIPYADRVAWLNQGMVEFYKDKEEVYQRISNQMMDDASSEYKGNEVLFDIRNMWYSTGGREILKNVNFSIYKGERVVILGENGCGKTTMMRLLSKIINPTSGEIVEYIDTRKKKKVDAYWFKKLGYIYQNPNYQIFMPQVMDEVGYQSPSVEATEKYMQQFDLTHLKNQHPHSLSEGQKRRLTIASICVSEPEVILLDEPTVGQDYDGLCKLIANLNQLHEQTGNTMITITHDYRCAQAVADRIIWLKDGTVYKVGGKELAVEYFNQNVDDAKKKSMEY